MRAKVLRVTYFALCLGLAVVALQWALDGWRARLPGRSSAHLVYFSLDALLFATALSVLFGWRITAWLAGISGGALILYAVSALSMGWDDAGGARGAIPLAAPTAILGVWSIALAINAWLKKREAV